MQNLENTVRPNQVEESANWYFSDPDNINTKPTSPKEMAN